MTSSAFFVIADISGYTKFVTETEIEHAKGILEALFGAILPEIKSPLTISGIQGDAIFAYSVDEDLASRQFILDFSEKIYCLFSRAKERIDMNSSCHCNACGGVGELDLKIIVHHGEYIEQKAGDQTELAGKEVIKAFRLLKNSVREKTGRNGYVLITEAAVKQMDLADYFTNAEYIIESHEHIGDTRCVVHGLREVWERNRDAERIFVADGDRLLIDEVVVSVPVNPDVAFTLCARPDLRTQFVAADKIGLPGGRAQRVDPGTVYQCHHGKDMFVFEIVDWRPGEYLTGRYLLPMGLSTLETIEFVPVGLGTKIRIRLGDLTGGNFMGRIMRPIVAKKLNKMLTPSYVANGERIKEMAADYSRRHGGDIVVAFDDLDLSRFLERRVA